MPFTAEAGCGVELGGVSRIPAVIGGIGGVERKEVALRSKRFTEGCVCVLCVCVAFPLSFCFFVDAVCRKHAQRVVFHSGGAALKAS